jgi:hypothetical protein
MKHPAYQKKLSHKDVLCALSKARGGILHNDARIVTRVSASTVSKTTIPNSTTAGKFDFMKYIFESDI